MITIQKYGKKTCAPCISINRIINRIKDVDFIYDEIDVENDRHLAVENNIISTPTVIFLKDDVEVFRFEGVKSSKEIKELIQKYS